MLKTLLKGRKKSKINSEVSSVDKNLSTESLKKIKLFDNIAKYAIYVLIGLLPVFFLPTSLIEIGQAKFGVLVIAVLVTTISLGISSIYKGSMELIDKKVWIPMVLISAVTFISAVFSTTYKDSFIGFGTELDSWYSISILLLVTVLMIAVINTKERIFTALSLFWVGFGFSAVFQILRLLASSFKIDAIYSLLSLGGRFDLPALNTIGTWVDFGVVAGVSALSLAITLDMVPLKDSIKKVSWFLFSVSLLMSFTASSILVGAGIDQLTSGSQFVIPSMFVIGFIALLFAIFQLVQKRNEGEIKSIKFPIASFVLVVFGFIIMVSPLAVNQKINQITGVPNESVLDIRPGFSDTYTVSKAVIGSSLKNSLIGSGPHGFYIEWNKYRPSYINNLDLWNTDYQFGVGFLPTILVNNGILGFLLWIVSLMLLFVYGGIKVFKTKNYTSIVLFVSALFLWINALINVSGSMVLILTFIFTGLMLAKFVLDNNVKMTKYSFEGKIKIPFISKNKLSIAVVILFSLIVLCFAVLWIQRTRAQVYSLESTQMIYAKNANISTVPKAMSLLQKAYDIYPSDFYARGINNLALVQVNYDISSSPANQDLEALKNGQKVDMSSSTVMYLQKAVSSGQSSVELNPNDFRNFLQFGSTMQTVALLNLEQDAGNLAAQSFLQAVNLAPNHPLTLYSLANLYVLAGDKESAKVVLEQTLKIKPGFMEANDLYQSINTQPVVVSTSTKATSTVKSITKPSVKTKAPIKKQVIKKSTSTKIIK